MTSRRVLRTALGLAAGSMVAVASAWWAMNRRYEAPNRPSRALKFTAKLSPFQKKIVHGERLQLAHPATYDASYRRISYPGGDVPLDRGACTDVVVRAYRNAGIDLQQLVHEDALNNYASYPRREVAPDTNIDHRRVPNLAHYFKIHALSLTLDPKRATEWQPGDVVCWKLYMGHDHIGIVSDKIGPRGLPMVIHNMQLCREEDVLDSWRVVGHFRYPAVAGTIRDR